MDVHVSDLALPQCRLQTGMRGAIGKPQGTVARVHIGQVMSIGTKLQNKEHVMEALCRAKFKLPSRQKIHISKKWGFTKFNANEFEDMVAEKRLIPDGSRDDEDESFARPCIQVPGTKEAPGFASTKDPERKNGPMKSGMAKKGSFTLLHPALP
ncbi:hypothetical protein H8959_010986 [Pygathrix nigripes]